LPKLIYYVEEEEERDVSVYFRKERGASTNLRGTRPRKALLKKRGPSGDLKRGGKRQQKVALKPRSANPNRGERKEVSSWVISGKEKKKI